jgi:hypothetical protein
MITGKEIKIILGLLNLLGAGAVMTLMTWSYMKLELNLLLLGITYSCMSLWIGDKILSDPEVNPL